MKLLVASGIISTKFPDAKDIAATMWNDAEPLASAAQQSTKSSLLLEDLLNCYGLSQVDLGLH
jgi:hypothetical protein